MRKIISVIIITCFGSIAFSQSQEAQQLLLNWEKLTQFKKILKDMYAGYKIVYKGYTTIKDISEGNFDLHRDFLDGLLQVSPTEEFYGQDNTYWIIDGTSDGARVTQWPASSRSPPDCDR